MDEYEWYNAIRIQESKNNFSDFDKSVKQIESGKSRNNDEDT